MNRDSFSSIEGTPPYLLWRLSCGFRCVDLQVLSYFITFLLLLSMNFPPLFLFFLVRAIYSMVVYKEQNSAEFLVKNMNLVLIHLYNV
ncbi:MAG: hypothetical protein ACTSPN_12445 [Promethearchaeota archaeon]